jgi:hypothetical protein
VARNLIVVTLPFVVENDVVDVPDVSRRTKTRKFDSSSKQGLGVNYEVPSSDLRVQGKRIGSNISCFKIFLKDYWVFDPSIAFAIPPLVTNQEMAEMNKTGIARNFNIFGEPAVGSANSRRRLDADRLRRIVGDAGSSRNRSGGCGCLPAAAAPGRSFVGDLCLG